MKPFGSTMRPRLIFYRDMSVPPKDLGCKVVVRRGQTAIRDTPLDWSHLARLSSSHSIELARGSIELCLEFVSSSS
ncbi:unnamed protein product [Microthlaspi erraticum]|uniref:Uncharacterized protein n=1 Tax=Microthlaspi erraticum TaxID=1685480 RepID=A0A6D2J655_9BRAS|nr:unnamed protein product [Microthlaspi erraticum]